jgi:type I restriction enzyme S subunit
MKVHSGQIGFAPLSAVCSNISSGGTPSRKQAHYFSSNRDAHPWFKSKELLDSAMDDSEEHISDAGLQNSSAKYYPEHTVLLAMYGANVGQLGWLRRPATVNQAICALVAEPSICNSRYLFYALLMTRDKLAAQAQGAAQQNLNQDLIRQFEVPVPPLRQQERIVGVLGAYDDLIENNTHRIAIIEEMARALYREWFVEFHFPGHEKVRMVESEIGWIPSGWGAAKLKELADVNARSIRRGAEPGTLAYVDIASVSTGAIEAIQRMPFSEAPGRARRLVQDGDTIWSCVRPNRRSFSLVLDPDPELVVSTGFAVLIPKAVPFAYIYLTATTEEFTAYLTNHARGAAYPAVTATDFENAVVLKPGTSIVERFQDAVEPLLRLKETLRRKNLNLRKTRDLLLPNLVSGEIDVSRTIPGAAHAS